jgi:hypothetical protein
MYIDMMMTLTDRPFRQIEGDLQKDNISSGK